MSRIILITGGTRSGKSAEAERKALALSRQPVYVATAQVFDDEFRQRVTLHQQRRGPEWTTIEEPLFPSSYDLTGRVVLVDCLTLWLTNFLSETEDADKALAAVEEEFDKLTAQDATFIFVTNEIGMGGTSANALQRKFTDIQGLFNQYVARRADEVVLMVSGIPVTIKQ